MMNFARVIAASLLLALLFVLPGWAADLTVKVNKDTKVATVTNTLSIPVTMLYLVGRDKMNLPLFAKLSPKGTAEVPLRFVMPKTVAHANCEITSPPEGFTRPNDGRVYHLSVEILP